MNGVLYPVSLNILFEITYLTVLLLSREKYHYILWSNPFNDIQRRKLNGERNTRNKYNSLYCYYYDSFHHSKMKDQSIVLSQSNFRIILHQNSLFIKKVHITKARLEEITNKLLYTRLWQWWHWYNRLYCPNPIFGKYCSKIQNLSKEFTIT